MGDAENGLPPSKKRAAGKELSRDNPGLDDDEDTELETGTFKKASEEVLAARRIVKVRRNPTTSTPSSNPFAGIRLAPVIEASETPTSVTSEALPSGEKDVSEDVKKDASKETEKGKDESSKQSESKTDELVAEVTASDETKKCEDDGGKDKENGANTNEAAKSEVDNEKAVGVDKIENEDEKNKSGENIDSGALSSFQQLSSSQNAFTGVAGTGFSTSTFSFGSLSKDGSSSGSSFGLGLNNNGNSSSIFSAPGASAVSKSEGSGFPSKQEVVVETGEENERVVFTADSVLFEFLDGGWKERGKGELKVNVSTTVTGKARILMRARGNYRLILNASLYPDMKLTNMDKKGITFACINSTGEGKDGLCTFALKFKDVSMVEEFRSAVMAHKDTTAAVLKTPENSPED